MLRIFLLVSFILHATAFASVALLVPEAAVTEPQVIKVGLTTKYISPGVKGDNPPNPTAKKEPVPEKKVEKKPEKKAVKPIAKKKPVKKVVEKKEVISRNTEPKAEEAPAVEPAQIPDASAESGKEQKEVAFTAPANSASGGAAGSGEDASGAGRGMEIGYPEYGVNPKPEYPQIARRNGYEGMVVLNVFVLEDGSVGRIQIRRSSGYDVLDRCALDAVREWIFVPGKRNGAATQSWVTVPIRFDLTSG